MANIDTISILVLFLLGVVSSRHISYYDNESEEEPIITASQERRICAELCMSGLGGEPCGQSCQDVIPQGLPTVSQSGLDSRDVDITRKDSCPVLCGNRLGYPLCGCNYTLTTTPFFKADFLQICSHFCLRHSYQIFGCDACEIYKNMTNEGEDSIVGVSAQVRKNYDWNSWCVQMCKNNDGGSACNCDLMPLALEL